MPLALQKGGPADGRGGEEEGICHFPDLFRLFTYRECGGGGGASPKTTPEGGWAPSEGLMKLPPPTPGTRARPPQRTWAPQSGWRGFWTGRGDTGMCVLLVLSL